MVNPRLALATLGGAAAAAALVGLTRGADAGGDADDKTTVTIWRAPAMTPNPYAGYPYGGYGYGGMPGGDAAFVAHRRHVQIAAEGELRFPGVSTRIDPSTVQFRSLTDAKGTSVVEQRYAYDLGSPDKLMRRYLGKQVTITTSRGEIAGILRGVDADSLVVETGQGAARAVQIVRRGGHLLDVRLAAGEDGLATVPTLVWKVVSKKPGKQQIEVSYRTDGLRWNADYTAILDEPKAAIDLSAWATIANDTGVDYRDAEVVLVTGVLDSQPAPANPYGYGYVARTPTAEPRSFTVPRPVTVAAGATVQVELMPARSAIASRRVVVYETTQDMSAQWQAYPQLDCYSGYVAAGQGARGELALELEAPAKGTLLPEGKIRVYRRKGDSLELLGEDALKVNASSGHARLRLGNDDTIQGSRQSLECKVDERTRTLREKIEIKVENKGKEAVEVILREYMYRWVNWRMDGEDVAGTKAANQTQEYRVKLGPGAKRSFQYTVVYAW